MVADGTFPASYQPGEMTSAPRVGDGLIRLDAGGKVSYASPNAQSAYRRLGLTAHLVGEDLTAVTIRLADDPLEGGDAGERIQAALRGEAPARKEVEARGATMLQRALPLLPAGVPIGALVLVRAMASLLYGTSAYDPVTFIAASALLASFFAFDTGFLGGVFVSAADINGDNRADIVAGVGSGSSEVRVFSGQNQQLLATFSVGTGTPSGVPRPVVKRTTCAPATVSAVAETPSLPGAFTSATPPRPCGAGSPYPSTFTTGAEPAFCTHPSDFSASVVMPPSLLPGDGFSSMGWPCRRK